MTISGYSQKNKLKYAERLFSSLQYKEAAIEYENQFEKGLESQLLFEHLGDCYFYNTDMKNAHKWYSRLIELYEEEVDAEYFFRYAHSLQGIEKHREAKKWMKRFSKETFLSDERQKNYKKPQKLDIVLDQKSNYKLKNVSTNTKFSDFGASYYGDKIVFASARSEDSNVEKYYWNNQPYLNIFEAYPNGEYSDIEDAVLFSKSINTKYHESNAVFTKDLKKVFFTRNNYKKRLGGDKEGVNHLKLYSADVVKKKEQTLWENIEELPFNSDDYSVGHPALNKKEDKLYFTSDMPGSIGESDIFVVDVLSNNTYSTPKNLGDKVNTSGKEMFPFVVDGTLYFSSNGHLGFGALDVFKTVIDNEQSYINITNLGAPVNSPKDDFSFVFNSEIGSGFLSSNRDGGKGDDDIYTVIPINLESKESCEQGVFGVVTNIYTREVIPNATLDLFDELGKKIANTKTNNLGQYNFNTTVNCNSRFEIKVSKQGYNTVVKPTLTEGVTGLTELPLAIETKDKLIVEENGLLKIKIGIIYFNLDKSFIRNDAAIELNKIVILMRQYPKMVIKIESHTDSRSPVDYNLSLSDKRAKSTKKYLISQGIEASRIESAIGYGESRLINKCEDNVKCTETEHQLNRRSEFIIVKM